jgi:hypothetical protein
MALVAEAERVVELPRDRAFELFIDFPRWREWMPRGFQPLSGPQRPLREGDQLRVRIPPIPVVALRVLRVRPHEEVCWGGGGPGLRAEHSFFFDEVTPSTTRVRSVEPWTGPITKLGPLARQLLRMANQVGAAQLDGFVRYAGDVSRE